MMKKTFQLWITLCVVAASTIFTGCKKDDVNDSDFNPKHFHGAFITCEGGFNANNGSISFLDDNTGKVANHFYESVNGSGLGDIVQSFSVAGDKGYIVVNNSQKIEVVDMVTFKKIGTITELDYPRYFLGVDNKRGYLTNGSGAGQVLVIDLANDEIIDRVDVGNGPEALVKVGDKVFVANSGGFGVDETVSVIDTRNGDNKLIENITVGKCPVAMVVDKNNDLWVLCKGVYSYTENKVLHNARLVKINTTKYSIEKDLEFEGTLGSYGTRLLGISPEKDVLYFGNGGIFKMNISSETLPAEALINAPSGSFYGLAVIPDNGDLYGFEQVWTGGQSGPGKMYRYNNNGEKIDDFTTGIGPNGVVFH